MVTEIKNRSKEMNNFSILSDVDGIIEGETPSDLKQTKRLYQLSKSQFVFTIVQRQNNTFYPFPSTSVYSSPMAECTTAGGSTGE